jgi:hypothetical protein
MELHLDYLQLGGVHEPMAYVTFAINLKNFYWHKIIHLQEKTQQKY